MCCALGMPETWLVLGKMNFPKRAAHARTGATTWLIMRKKGLL